jgi:hypothetical protein
MRNFRGEVLSYDGDGAPPKRKKLSKDPEKAYQQLIAAGYSEATSREVANNPTKYRSTTKAKRTLPDGRTLYGIVPR